MILLTGSYGLVGQSIHADNIIRLSSKDVDLRDFIQVCRLFENHPEITGVIHLAANVGGLFKNMREPVEMFEDNVLMNLNVLRAAHKYNVNRVLCCLSTCIFPDKPPDYPITPEMLHYGPPHESNEAYAYAKRVMEVHCRTYQREYNREYFCVIPTNIYGPNDNFSLKNGHVIPSLINRCYLAKKAGEDFVIAGDGTPLRQFIFSEDVGKMIIKCYENPQKNPVVLCPPEAEYTISHVANCIAKAMKFTGNIVYDKSRPNGQHKKTARASDLLESYTSLEEGIQKTVDWFIEKNSGNKLLITQGSQAIQLIRKLFSIGINPGKMQVVTTVAESNSCFLEFIKYYNLKYYIVNKDNFNNTLESIFLYSNFDICISFSNQYILSPANLSHRSISFVNYHPGILPNYKGSLSTVHSLINSEEYVGGTWHYMVNGVDKGNIIASHKNEIGPYDTAFSLNHKIFNDGIEAIEDVIRLVNEGFPGTPQENTGRFYYNKFPDISHLDQEKRHRITFFPPTHS
jgi:GDP-L-fucose synthase